MSDTGLPPEPLAAALEPPLAPQLLEEHGEGGQLLQRAWLRDGVLHGPFEQFSAQGRTLMKTHFEAGKMHGPMAVFAPDGKLIQQSQFQHGIAHGLMETYVNGRCVARQMMVDGVAAGQSLSYDEAGHLSARLNMFDGQIHGPAEFFYEGLRVRKSHYKAGLMDGESTDYDAQGGVVQTCNYRANLLHGPLRRYWPDGELMEEVIYRDGKPVGSPARFDPKGKRTDNAAAAPAILDRLHKLVRGS